MRTTPFLELSNIGIEILKSGHFVTFVSIYKYYYHVNRIGIQVVWLAFNSFPNSSIYITYIGDYAYESRKERNEGKKTGENKKLVKISSF